MTAQPKPTAADVLREHREVYGPARCSCGGWSATLEAFDARVSPDAQFAQHQADMLAAAGLLATAEPIVVEVHHHDIEKHAESFNEGYETAVAQGLADDPTLAADWLAEHDAQVAAQAVNAATRDAADLLHSEARWQYEQHLAGRAAAQAISLRVSMLEQILRDRLAGGAT